MNPTAAGLAAPARCGGVDDELRERRERLDEMLDLYDLLTLYWQEWIAQEVRAVVLLLLEV